MLLAASVQPSGSPALMMGLAGSSAWVGIRPPLSSRGRRPGSLFTISDGCTRKSQLVPSGGSPAATLGRTTQPLDPKVIFDEVLIEQKSAVLERMLFRSRITWFTDASVGA